MTITKVHLSFDGRVIAEIQTSQSVCLDGALATAHDLFRNRSGWLETVDRIVILRKAADIITSRREVLANSLAQESNKTHGDTLSEVDRAVDCLHSCAGEVRSATSNLISNVLTQKAPIGVVVCVIEGVAHIDSIVQQVATAVAAGAPVVIIPGPQALHGAHIVLNFLREAGLPTRWAQIALRTRMDQKTSLFSDPRVAVLSSAGCPEISGDEQHRDARIRASQASALPLRTDAPIHIFRNLGGTPIGARESTTAHPNGRRCTGIHQSEEIARDVARAMRAMQIEELAF
ncbi:aldehyde dehydrogenase family protein [Pseudomonas sp. BGr12]|uniref:aldehyde dehydrogenase family protein n=1 Tax=Pseudomonas sp. BGr12 TaxID=2936269 RepID=UPI002559E654|nr:aldehyde dehydrogenase family protein [Pseudomonas sp. BJa5]MDL2428452.1 aldehyde dehydrogenase family protein [Pseudomonas sp. BJa5]